MIRKDNGDIDWNSTSFVFMIVFLLWVVFYLMSI